jgi:hypothetical protein
MHASGTDSDDREDDEINAFVLCLQRRAEFRKFSRSPPAAAVKYYPKIR